MLQAAGVPVVETWDLPATPIEHTVGFSNAEAAAAMVRHLHGKGYRRIAFIGGTSNRDTRGADRQRGYAEAIRELGLPDGRVISFGQAADLRWRKAAKRWCNSCGGGPTWMR